MIWCFTISVVFSVWDTMQQRTWPAPRGPLAGFFLIACWTLWSAPRSLVDLSSSSGPKNVFATNKNTKAWFEKDYLKPVIIKESLCKVVPFSFNYSYCASQCFAHRSIFQDDYGKPINVKIQKDIFLTVLCCKILNVVSTSIVIC